MPVLTSINEPGTYAFEGMAPVSGNEPKPYPTNVLKPTISGVVPNTAAVLPRGPPFSIVVSGTGFIQGSVVFLAGQQRPTVYNDANTLTATIQRGAFLAPQTTKVQVRNGTYPSTLADFTFT